MLKDNPLGAIKTQDDIAGMRVGSAEGVVVPEVMKTEKVTWYRVREAV